LQGGPGDEGLVRYARSIVEIHRQAGRLDADVGSIAISLPQLQAGDDTPELAPSAGGAPAATSNGEEVLLTAPRAVRLVQAAAAGPLLGGAAEDGCDVVLVGDGPGGAGDRVLAERLVREWACSVWLVPGNSVPAVRRILVPVDFSPRSADSLRVATTLARLCGGAECLAVHVHFNDSPVAGPEQQRQFMRELLETYARFMGPIDCLGVPVTPLFREGTDVTRAILRAAEETSADLVVMASRGRTPLGSLLLPSLAGQVLCQSAVAVLVVKHFGARLGWLGVLRHPAFRRKNDLRFR
jgi:nucleotide-binding universal stress UspA family protein